MTMTSYHLQVAYSIACVAGGISRASALVLVAKWRSRERIGEEATYSNLLDNSVAHDLS